MTTALHRTHNLYVLNINIFLYIFNKFLIILYLSRIDFLSQNQKVKVDIQKC